MKNLLVPKCNISRIIFRASLSPRLILPQALWESQAFTDFWKARRIRCQIWRAGRVFQREESCTMKVCYLGPARWQHLRDRMQRMPISSTTDRCSHEEMILQITRLCAIVIPWRNLLQFLNSCKRQPSVLLGRHSACSGISSILKVKCDSYGVLHSFLASPCN